jgi:hypothetical protein
VVDIVWRGDLIRIDDDVIKAPDSETTITVSLERTSARILVPPPRGMRRLWPEMERQMNQRQCGSRANALSRSILRKSSLLKPNSPKPCT